MDATFREQVGGNLRIRMGEYGENSYEFRVRLYRFLADIVKNFREKDIVVVISHSSPIAVMEILLKKIHQDKSGRHHTQNGELKAFEIRENDYEKININTAPTLLLASLDEKLDVNTVATVLQEKQKKMEPFANVGELLAVQPFDSMSDEGKNLANKMLDVKSDYFKIQVEVILSNRKRQLSSHVFRKDKQVTIYARSMAPFIFQP